MFKLLSINSSGWYKVGRKVVERRIIIRTVVLVHNTISMQPAFEKMHYQRDKRKFADRFPVTGAQTSCNRFLIATRIPAAHHNNSILLNKTVNYG